MAIFEGHLQVISPACSVAFEGSIKAGFSKVIYEIYDNGFEIYKTQKYRLSLKNRNKKSTPSVWKCFFYKNE